MCVPIGCSPGNACIPADLIEITCFSSVWYVSKTQAAEVIVNDLIGAERSTTQQPPGASASLPLFISPGEIPF